MKRVVTFVVLTSLALFMVVFLGRCKRDIMYLKVRFDQDMAIGALLETSAQLRGYSLRDKDAGRMFGGHRKLKANPFYILAVMFSGQKIFPAGDYDYSIVFPICAKSEPGYMDMLEDLRNPKRVFAELGQDYVPQPRDAIQYNDAKMYFLGNFETTRTIDVIFKSDCVNKYFLLDGDVVLDRITVDVPVRNSIEYDKSLKGD